MAIYFIVFSLIALAGGFIAFKRFGSKIDTSAANSGAFEVFEIRVPKIDENQLETSPLSAENMFASLHGLLREDTVVQENISFEIVSTGREGLKFYFTAPPSAIKFVESQLYAQYPTAQLIPVSDYTEKYTPRDSFFEVSYLSFSKPDFFPIKTFRDFETDPLSGLTSSFSEVLGEESLWMQVLVRPTPDTWQNDGYKYTNAIREGIDLKKSSGSNPFADFAGSIGKEMLDLASNIAISPFRYNAEVDRFGKPVSSVKPAGPPKLTPVQENELSGIENKLAKMGYKVVVRVMSSSNTQDRVVSNLRSVVASLKQFTSTSSNAFVSTISHDRNYALDAYIKRQYEDERAVVMNVEELATLYHMPSNKVETPNISWIHSKKAEPPSTLPITDCNYMGETMYRSSKVRFGMANTDDRLRHMYLIGKSGTGKSTLLETMIAQDIQNGAGVGVLDPHGETIDKVLEHIPDNRIEDVIYFDPSDTERPIGLNLLEMEDPSQKNIMASALVSAIKHHFDFSWGPRLEYLLNYAILTLLEVPGTTLLGITRLLEDDNYRKFILHYVKDPVVLRFWETEFKNLKGNQKFATEAIAPIQNKVNRFLASTTIRNILGQRKSTINLWEAMNNGKIVLMNLSKGKIGTDNSNLLGALLVSRIQFMALQRAKIPYKERRPFYLYVDEFQNFATGSFEEILSESRKYGLGLYLTHQFTDQLPETLLKAVFGNVGTIATFSLGAPDAKVLANEFAPYFDQSDIISLERFNIYIKLMIDGMTSLPFSARILLPWESGSSIINNTPNKEKVIARSREKYGTDRIYVEEKINKWVETNFDKGLALAQEAKDRKPSDGVRNASGGPGASEFAGNANH